MLSLARTIANATDAAEAEVAEAAGRVHRYFAVSLPLHLQDEEQSIKPRLAADEALELMSRQHREHDRLLEKLLRHWQALASDPRRERAALRDELTALAADFEEHLRLEERTVFPAIARLPPDAQAEIIREMEARRSSRGT